jgi:hypothetical protein
MNPAYLSPINDVQRNLLRILTITTRTWGVNPTRCTVKRRASRVSRRSPFYALRWAW